MKPYFSEDRKLINEIIHECKNCYLAMSVDNEPYVLPMNFAFKENMVVFHLAKKGRMWETLGKNPRVCINWTLGEELKWQDVRVGCSYGVKSKSVIAEGTAEIVDDYDEKYHLLGILMKQYSDREFKFSKPAVLNVGIVKVSVQKIVAKIFGEKGGKDKE